MEQEREKKRGVRVHAAFKWGAAERGEESNVSQDAGVARALAGGEEPRSAFYRKSEAIELTAQSVCKTRAASEHRSIIIYSAERERAP